METSFDFVIVGAGPAGLSAAQYASRGGLRTLLLDAGLPGGQVGMIFNLENYPGFFPAANGFEFIEKMKSQAEAFGATILQAAVSSVDKIQDEYSVKTSAGTFTAQALLLATGAEHRKLGVPGEKEFFGRGVSYCATCDGPFFRKKKIIVVGGGDSACDEATYLSTIGEVTVVHRRSSFRAQKAVAERVLSNPAITVKFNSSVSAILGDAKVTSVELTDTVTGEKSVLPADGVFVSVGMLPKTDLVSALQKDEAGYIVTGEDMATSVPGLYAAGDVRSKSFRQVVTACADGAIAANSAQKFIRKMRGEEYK